MFLYYLINIVSESNKKTKLIQESSIPLCSAETRNDLKPPETTQKLPKTVHILVFFSLR